MKIEGTIGHNLVEFDKYKSVAYHLKDGKQSKRCELVTEQMPIFQFMRKFKDEIVYEYAKHTHRARWLDEQLKLCKDTFPIGTIISVVDFVEKYTFQPQMEVQSQYYNLVQVAIFVHIPFLNSPDSTKNDQKNLREYQFYISDDHTHSTEFLQGCFQLFYGD